MEIGSGGSQGEADAAMPVDKRKIHLSLRNKASPHCCISSDIATHLASPHSHRREKERGGDSRKKEGNCINPLFAHTHDVPTHMDRLYQCLSKLQTPSQTSVPCVCVSVCFPLPLASLSDCPTLFLFFPASQFKLSRGSEINT